MKELIELKQELETLEVARAELEARYAELEEVWRNAPINWNHLGHPIGSPEKRAIESAQMDVDIQLQRTATQEAWITKRVTYLENLSTVDAEIEHAQKEEKAAAARVVRVVESLGRVTASLEQMTADAAQELERLQHAEQEAARAQARAAASGGDKAAREARAQMNEVVAGRRDAGAKHDADEHIANALEAEAEALRQQLEAAQDDQRKAAAAANAAERLKVGAEWDQAVGALREVGARLVELGGDYPLSGLLVPTFAPGSRAVSRDSLRRLVQQRAA